MGEEIVLLLMVVGFVLAAPIIAIMAMTRVRRLERRVAQLEARPAAVPPPIPVSAAVTPAAPMVTPPPAVATPPVVEPVTPIVQPVTSSATSSGAAPTAPVAMPATPAPSVPQTSFDWETVIAGRWLNRVGLLAVAVGVSYFLKYAIDNDWIGPRGQVAAGLLIGAGLVAWSAMFVKRGLGYFADGLAGLGAAVMYLSLWAGASYYRFMSPEAGFAAMIVVTAAMLTIALGRNSQTVAVLAMIGGFATPFLVSTGRDAQVVLFLYLALHNTALLALARARDWRLLELPAFVFTQIYFWGWYDQFYTDAALIRTALFATLFFAQFSALPVIRVRRFGVFHQEQYVLVLVNAAVFLLVLRTLLWPDQRWMLTLATLALSAFHVALARLVPARGAESPARLLLAGLALTFATLVIPIRLNGHWITLAWAVEAAILVWSGFANKLPFLRGAAYVIFFAVFVRLVAGQPLHATTFLFNARLATALVVAVSAGLAAWMAARHGDQLRDPEPVVVAVLAVAANVLMLWAATLETDLYFEIASADRALLLPIDVYLARSLTISLLWTLYATALVIAGVRMKAVALRWQGLALFGITTLKVFFADLSYLSGFYRIASSIALGVVLLIVSFLYQRSLALQRSTQEDAS